MRTTLTIDDDVATEIEAVRRHRQLNLKDIVNEALRRGLREMRAPPRKRKPFRTQTFNLGPALINIDNVWEAIAIVEGEDYK
jgi:hypothetical protein